MSLPSKSTLFKNIQRSKDSRGEILSIVDQPVCNVSLITCSAGSIRSNHYHHSDFHFMLYWINKNEASLIIRRLDDYEIVKPIKLKIIWRIKFSIANIRLDFL